MRRGFFFFLLMISSILSANSSPLRFIAKLYKGEMKLFNIGSTVIGDYCAALRLYNRHTNEFELSYIDKFQSPERYKKCTNFSKDNEFFFSSSNEKMYFTKPDNVTIDQFLVEVFFELTNGITYKDLLKCNNKDNLVQYLYAIEHTKRFPKKSLEYNPEYLISAKLDSLSAGLCPSGVNMDYLPKYTAKLFVRWIPLNVENYKIPLAKNRDSFYKGIFRSDVSEYNDQEKILIMADPAEDEWFLDFINEGFSIATMTSSSVPKATKNALEYVDRIKRRGTSGNIRGLVKFKKDGKRGRYGDDIPESLPINSSQGITPSETAKKSFSESQGINLVINTDTSVVNHNNFLGQIEGLKGLAPIVKGKFIFIDDEINSIKRGLITIENLIKKNLLSSDIEIIMVDNLNDATLAIENDSNIEAIFIDTDLSESSISGPEFVKGLRDQGKKLPIFSITSRTLSKADMAMYIQVGYNGYIPKTNLMTDAKNIADLLPYWVSYISRNNSY